MTEEKIGGDKSKKKNNSKNKNKNFYGQIIHFFYSDNYIKHLFYHPKFKFKTV